MSFLQVNGFAHPPGRVGNGLPVVATTSRFQGPISSGVDPVLTNGVDETAGDVSAERQPCCTVRQALRLPFWWVSRPATVCVFGDSEGSSARTVHDARGADAGRRNLMPRGPAPQLERKKGGVLAG